VKTTEPQFNIASTLEQLARETPDAPAIIVAKDNHSVSFHELNRASGRLASGLARLGLTEGSRVLLLVPFGVDFITLAFSIFKAGAVPVLIDPGLGRRNALHCIEQAKPQAMIAVPLAHAVKSIYRKPFKSVRTSITIGRKWFWGGETLENTLKLGTEDFVSLPRKQGDPAAVLFTSGSTGPSKGVLYTHGMFYHQVKVLKSFYGIQRGEIDLPTFPLFALFGISMGMTSILPEMDPTRPAHVDPRKIVSPILKFGVTSSFGSPALWNTVTRYCTQKNVVLPSLKRVLIAGAPVHRELLERFDLILEGGGEVHTPYGATEALPVTSFGRKEILAQGQNKILGTCVGKPIPGLKVRLIKITDDPIPSWSKEIELPMGEIGEIVVQGPWVTRQYFNREGATRLAKIQKGHEFWHRMGDVGWLDEGGRLWFCGRKTHRVVTGSGTLFTIPTEMVFNPHPEVKRSALVGTGPRHNQQAVIVIEPENPRRANNPKLQKPLVEELLQMAAANEKTRQIQTVLFHPGFPVDIRHNAKIGREKLARWAASRV